MSKNDELIQNEYKVDSINLNLVKKGHDVVTEKLTFYPSNMNKPNIDRRSDAELAQDIKNLAMIKNILTEVSTKIDNHIGLVTVEYARRNGKSSTCDSKLQ